MSIHHFLSSDSFKHSRSPAGCQGLGSPAGRARALSSRSSLAGLAPSTRFAIFTDESCDFVGNGHCQRLLAASCEGQVEGVFHKDSSRNPAGHALPKRAQRPPQVQIWVGFGVLQWLAFLGCRDVVWHLLVPSGF